MDFALKSATPVTSTLGKFFAIGLMCLSIIGCYRNDVVTVEISIPGLKNPDCGTIIQNNFNKYNTPKITIVQNVEFDFGTRTALITYDGRHTALRNIQHWIAEVGFQADDVAPFPGTQEKLPEGCR